MLGARHNYSFTCRLFQADVVVQRHQQQYLAYPGEIGRRPVRGIFGMALHLIEGHKVHAGENVE